MKVTCRGSTSELIKKKKKKGEIKVILNVVNMAAAGQNVSQTAANLLGFHLITKFYREQSENT